MRLFHELMFEQYIEGSTGFGGFSAPLHWVPIMGIVDTLRYVLIADHVAGTSLQLQVIALQRPEMTELFDSAFFPIFATGLTQGQTAMLSASVTPSDPDAPALYHRDLLVSLNGDPDPAPTPRAHVRIWVTGRGRA